MAKRSDFKQSYTPDFSKSPKFGDSNMPGGAKTIGKGIVDFKLSNPKGKKTDKAKNNGAKKK